MLAAKTKAKAGDRRAAMMALKKKKQYEQQVLRRWRPCPLLRPCDQLTVGHALQQTQLANQQFNLSSQVRT